MSNVNIQTTISPYTQKPVCTRPLLSEKQLDSVIAEAVKAQKSWKKVPLEERIAIAEKWLVEYEKIGDLIAEDISTQMGRPIGSSKGEVNGTLYRARHLIKIAKDCLAPIPQTESSTDAMKLTLVKQPLGVVAVLTPWNFPHMCTVNSVLPAILSGNSVLLKPAPQTPSSAERFLETFKAAGLPDKVLQAIHLSQDLTLSYLATDTRIDFISFTGSVAGGRAVARAAAGGQGFKGIGLELGGKDPAYVREDADVAYTAENLVDGAMFNSGQSCCSIERIYCHAAVYDEFVKKFVELAGAYKLGGPAKKETTLGPVVSVASAARIRKQIKDAVSAGATAVLEESSFPEAKEGTALLGPTVLTNVDHSQLTDSAGFSARSQANNAEMEVMMEETFGPVVGIMKVESDEEALSLMNDSPYGLTASVWTDPKSQTSIAAFNHFSEELECGTVYLNRADALEPSLPWSGWKDSGRGISLSALGYDQVTRTKGVMMRMEL